MFSRGWISSCCYISKHRSTAFCSSNTKYSINLVLSGKFSGSPSLILNTAQSINAAILCHFSLQFRSSAFVGPRIRSVSSASAPQRNGNQTQAWLLSQWVQVPNNNCSGINSVFYLLQTSKGYIIFFKLEVDVKSKTKHLFVVRYNDRWACNDCPINVEAYYCVVVPFRAARGGDEDSDRDSDRIPSLRLSQAGYIQVAGGVHRQERSTNPLVLSMVSKGRLTLSSCCSVVCLREELLVATGIGWLQRIRWDGLINSDMTIEVASIPFSVDLQLSRGTQTHTAVFHRILIVQLYFPWFQPLRSTTRTCSSNKYSTAFSSVASPLFCRTEEQRTSLQTRSSSSLRCATLLLFHTWQSNQKIGLVHQYVSSKSWASGPWKWLALPWSQSTINTR